MNWKKMPNYRNRKFCEWGEGGLCINCVPMIAKIVVCGLDKTHYVCYKYNVSSFPTKSNINFEKLDHHVRSLKIVLTSLVKNLFLIF